MAAKRKPVTKGIVWCRHCGLPHKIGDAVCPTTDLPLSQRVHKRLIGVEEAHQLVGTVLDGKYEILKLLGAGGMGEVFEANNRILGKRVAIKVVSNKSARAVARLRREASIIASIHHPNICDLYDVGTCADGSPYLVLELLTGETLQAAIRRRARLTPENVVEYFCQILSGLDAAHAGGIIHRDLKPSNIFIVERAGCTPIITLLDFGFARDTSGRFTSLTRPGHILGTSGYMSPEQVLGKPLDLRSDLFSVGIMLFEAVTGQHPFEAPSPREMSERIVWESPHSLHHVQPPVPAGIEAVMHRALEKSPAFRFSSAIEMQTALASSLDDT